MSSPSPDTPLQSFKGIGPKKAARLQKLGLSVWQDVLMNFPRAYEAIEPPADIRDAVPGTETALLVCFQGAAQIRRVRRGLTITTQRAADDTGSTQCIWYNRPYKTPFHEGKAYYIRGKVQKGPKGLSLENPVIEPYDPAFHNTAKILPVYALTAGITQQELRRLSQEALGACTEPDPMLESAAINFGYLTQINALKAIHYPQSLDGAEAARRRLAFDEFLQTALAFQSLRHRNQEKGQGPKLDLSPFVLKPFLEMLPYTLTNAQHRVLTEIARDTAGGRMMNRLIQGDVGSGKTIIAFLALLAAVRSGFQGVLMAPTEVLARQHHEGLQKLIQNTGIQSALLTGSTRGTEKKVMKEALAAGTIHILIGTHAVITEDVTFARLGLAVTDEQHRFGVRQRARLSQKGIHPHVLVMSATPIPRTIAHIYYGDLDLSVVDELPPGRTPIKTYAVAASLRERAYRFIRREAESGHQAYVICPLVEDSEKTEAKSAETLFEELKSGALSGLSLGLLHGRMAQTEKDTVLDDFRTGSIDVLISTTVIEVGIHVSNATVMLIENAERFGLAQLHQLRGRVGRGSAASCCILISDALQGEVGEKLKTLTETTDGFAIAEADLKLRGPGDLLGLRQSGLPGFHLANPITDYALFEQAQKAAEELLLSHGPDHPTIANARETLLHRRESIAMN